RSGCLQALIPASHPVNSYIVFDILILSNHVILCLLECQPQNDIT
ncbi:unnamed protein product, partial [Callosobruchus maculatus]